MKKTIVINGVEYVQKDAEGETPSVETPVTPATPSAPASAPADAEEGLDEAAEGAAQKILANIGIDKLQKTVEQLTQTLQESRGVATNKVALLDLENLMHKKVDQMTPKEKIVGFFQAMVTRNEAALKALAEGVNADGGYLFPPEFRAEIIRDLEDLPHMRGEVRVVPMMNNTMNIPTLVSGPKVTWTNENATKSTTTAHFGQATLTAYKMAAIMYVSDELVDDAKASVDIVQFIVGLFSEAIGNEEDRVITAGSGSGQPTGLTTASIGSVASASGNLSFDDLINLEYLLPAKYHRNAKFMVHRNNIRELRKIKDSNNRYLWQEAVAPGQPATFHGYPVIENNWLAESVILFGDYKQAYWLGDRQKMTVKISQDTETAFTKDETAVRVVSRIAGNVVLSAAVKKLTGIA